MYLKRQIFLVFGVSKSGGAVAKFLLSKGGVVYLYDELSGERVEQAMQILIEQGARRVTSAELSHMSEVCDGLILSPGIPIDHPLAVAFKRRGRAVLGESELASRYLRAPILAVTGTNGKTTTVSMLTEVLQKGGLSARACGNIGTPMIECVGMGEEEVAVAEISSFQLETLQSLRPHVGVVLNISEDHLNRHYNMENYIFLKSKLLKNMGETEFAVLNYDDETVRAFAEKTKAQVLYFSVRERVNGAFYEDGYLYFGKEKILPVSDLPARGVHTIQNALAVIAAAKIMGIKTADIIESLTAFKGIKHRIEEVGKVNGVTYIDDSKGTNVDATMKAIECMQEETILLLGGKDKGYSYAKLFAKLPSSKVIHVILYGENRFTLLATAREQGYTSVTLCEELTFAVRIASLKAKSGQTVLLSPASASFDAFTSYEERGEKFVEVVEKLREEEGVGREEEMDENFNRDETITPVEEDGDLEEVE